MHALDPMQAARLAQLEGAMCALLRECASQLDPNDQPDGLTVRLHPETGLDLEYTRGGIVVVGEGV